MRVKVQINKLYINKKNNRKEKKRILLKEGLDACDAVCTNVLCLL